MGSNIIMAVGALLIFGTFLSSSNKLMTNNTQVAEQNEYYITAVSLAQSVIDEAKTKAYDQKTIGKQLSVVDSLTGPVSLGPNTGEFISLPDTLNSASPYTASARGYLSTYRYNDVDDYNNYSRLVNTQRTEGYQINVTVKYVSETNPDLEVGTRSWCKKMTVAVTSPYFPKIDKGGGVWGQDTVKFSYVFSY